MFYYPGVLKYYRFRFMFYHKAEDSWRGISSKFIFYIQYIIFVNYKSELILFNLIFKYGFETD